MTIAWHALGPNLECLIRQQPGRLNEAVAISPIASTESRRAAFRLEFTDGRTLKGRYLETAQQGETVWRLSNAHLRSAPVAHVIARRSDALLEEWLPGLPLGADCDRPEHVRVAGALLGRLHRINVQERNPQRAVEPRWIDDSLDADWLVKAGHLDAAAAREAASVARASAPASAEWGFCHGDFCAENLLLVPVLGLHVVDNETICELWQDYDLARTWYRWPMDTSAFAAFLDGYRVHRAADEFLAHFAFWTIAALLRSAAFRLRSGVSPAVPLQRLTSLLDAPSPSPSWTSP
jgi:Ser/Thr protein kinase RdoA (MazF antagonist)